MPKVIFVLLAALPLLLELEAVSFPVRLGTRLGLGLGLGLGSRSSLGTREPGIVVPRQRSLCLGVLLFEALGALCGVGLVGGEADLDALVDRLRGSGQVRLGLGLGLGLGFDTFEIRALSASRASRRAS